MNNHSEAHQQGRQAARQLLAEYACPTCASSRSLPALPMAEMLIQAMQQSPADSSQFIVGWCEVLAPILTSAIDTAEPELCQRDLDEDVIRAAITAASFVSMGRIKAMPGDTESQGVIDRLVAAVGGE